MRVKRYEALDAHEAEQFPECKLHAAAHRNPARHETIVLSKLTISRLAGMHGLQNSLGKCVLEDDLASVLESLKKADVIIMLRRLRGERYAFQNMQ